jgi:hypothetical protein
MQEWWEGTAQAISDMWWMQEWWQGTGLLKATGLLSWQEDNLSTSYLRYSVLNVV